MHRRITMVDIARHVGVHETTVSLALRNHPRLPVDTRQRIQAVAASLGYRPDPSIRALNSLRKQKFRTRHHATLAYLGRPETDTSAKSSRRFLALLSGASRRASELGYNVKYFLSTDAGEPPTRLTKLLSAQDIKGLLVGPKCRPRSGNQDHTPNSVFSVHLDLPPMDSPISAVSSDYRGMAREAVERAESAGYRRIGMILSDSSSTSVNNAWRAGYYAGRSDPRDIGTIPILTLANGTVRRSREILNDHQSIKLWLEKYRPQLVLGSLALLKSTFKKLNLTIPRDFSFADLSLESATGEIAGIQEQLQRVGEIAIDHLHSLIDKNEFRSRPVKISTLVAGIWRPGSSMPEV